MQEYERAVIFRLGRLRKGFVYREKHLLSYIFVSSSCRRGEGSRYILRHPLCGQLPQGGPQNCQLRCTPTRGDTLDMSMCALCNGILPSNIVKFIRLAIAIAIGRSIYCRCARSCLGTPWRWRWTRWCTTWCTTPPSPCPTWRTSGESSSSCWTLCWMWLGQYWTISRTLRLSMSSQHRQPLHPAAGRHHAEECARHQEFKWNIVWKRGILSSVSCLRANILMKYLFQAISHVMQNALDEATDPWGVKVERVEM